MIFDVMLCSSSDGHVMLAQAPKGSLDSASCRMSLLERRKGRAATIQVARPCVIENEAMKRPSVAMRQPIYYSIYCNIKCSNDIYHIICIYILHAYIYIYVL